MPMHVVGEASLTQPGHAPGQRQHAGADDRAHDVRIRSHPGTSAVDVAILPGAAQLQAVNPYAARRRRTPASCLDGARLSPGTSFTHVVHVEVGHAWAQQSDVFWVAEWT